MKLRKGDKLEKQFRAVQVDGTKLDEENRTIDISFSSEEPYERYWGVEVLSHDNGAMKLNRLNDGAALLWNHDTDKMIGVVERASIENKRGVATVRFSDSPFAQEKFNDVKAGILRNVSFGYQINKMEKVKSDSKSGDEFLVTDYMPFEISFVSVPADQTVGVGRADGDEETTVEVEDKTTGARKMDEEQKRIEAEKAAAKARAEGMDAERARINAITALGEKFEQKELARQLIESGKDINVAREAMLEKISSRQTSIGKDGEGTAELGLTKKEKQNFSFMRAINALANPTNRKLQELAAFEREVSEAGSKLRGKESQGFYVPFEVLAFQRDLSKGTPSAGGYLVGTEHRPADFISMLRKKSILDRAGARVLNGLMGDIAIPKQSGGATAYWVGEGSAPTESQQTFGQVAMAPKTVGAFTDVSRKLMIQSSPDVEQLIKSDLATVLALAVDLAGLYGLGSSNQPLGIVNTPGINTKDFAAAKPTYAELVDMETLIAADDADVEAMKYLIEPSVRGHAKVTPKFGTGTEATIWEPGNLINGYPALVSNQIVSEDVIFGNFSDLIMGYWSGIDLNVDMAALSTSGGARVIVLQDCDVAVRNAVSFCLGNDAQ